ncbi:MAG: methionyl-tRNA formyltransferase [Oligoflexus sp.]
MRIVFMGSPVEVIAPLQSLLDWCQNSAQHQVVGVVSQPPRPSGRSRRLQDPPLAQFAKEQGLAVLQPEKARAPEFLEQLRAWQPDIAVTAAYGQILSDDFLAIPKRATINIHPSLLPAYRGATPVQSALLDQLETSGVTILFTVKQLDAGAIIVQQASDIARHERAGELMQRLFQLGGTLLPQAIESLQDPEFVGTAQDPEKVTHCSKIQKTDGQINWQDATKSILARYRAYHPWPSSFTFYDDKRIVIEELALVDQDLPASAHSLPIGGFIFHKPWKALVIRTGDGFLVCERLKPQGAKSLDAASFCNGLKGEKKGIFQ